MGLACCGGLVRHPRDICQDRAVQGVLRVERPLHDQTARALDSESVRHPLRRCHFLASHQTHRRLYRRLDSGAGQVSKHDFLRQRIFARGFPVPSSCNFVALCNQILGYLQRDATTPQR